MERGEARGPEGQGTANPNLPPQEPGARGWRTRDWVSRQENLVRRGHQNGGRGAVTWWGESLNRGGGWRGGARPCSSAPCIPCAYWAELDRKRSLQGGGKGPPRWNSCSWLARKGCICSGGHSQNLSLWRERPQLAQQNGHWKRFRALYDHSPGAEDDAAGGQLGPTAQKRCHEERSRESPRCGPGRKSVRGSP